MDMEEKKIQHIDLTPREKDIIEALKAGCITDIEIGKKLNISIPTVSTFMQKIYSKFCLDGEHGQPRAKLVWEVMR